ncbi:putative dual specificity protein phosphatase DSP8 [Hordeum vulgare]|nr:putative dual specificity protein phosphatase DSP8 [Hordeum vulgare]
MDSSPTAPSDIRKVHHARLQLRHSAFFCAFGFVWFHHPRRSHIDHDYLDHGYITMIGYLDIDINGLVYSNSSATTPVNSVRVVTSVHATPAVTAGGNREETRKAPEEDAVTTLGIALQGNSTYVHCKAGRGRSTTVVLRYLIKYKGMDPKQAWVHTKSIRPRICLTSAQQKAVTLFSTINPVGGDIPSQSSAGVVAHHRPNTRQIQPDPEDHLEL